MNIKSKRILVAIVSLSIFFSQTALAARVGGGRSVGMQRSISKPMNNNNYSRGATTQQQPMQQQAQPQRQGMGVGTGVALGAVAGAAGGYMLGKSMANNGANSNVATNANESQSGVNVATNGEQNVASVAKSESNIPWGIIAILVALLVIGLAIFRRKSTPQLAQPNNSANNNFKIPGINKNHNYQQTNGHSKQTQSHVGGMFGNKQQQPKVSVSDDRMPDGIEVQYFLRQAKGMFLHIQSMNTPENVTEVAKYMSQELYDGLKEDVANNKFIADFSQLDCQLLECDDTIPPQIIATVQFNGMISEEPNQPAIKFSEIWHFTKNNTPNSKWIVSGIQQTNTVN